MDIRTGKTYETREAALAAGVPESDIAELVGEERDRSVPEVRFSSGPFKNRTYKRLANGGLVRTDKPAPGRGMVIKNDGNGNPVAVKP